KFLATGITDVQYDSFSYNSTWQKNIIATIPGSLDPSAEMIVGGHLDSYSSNQQQAPGADDNASGTAAALEMARVLKLVNYQPSFTFRFMGFAAEEAGLRGSADYAAKADAQDRDIRAMLNYDMIANRTQSQSDRDYLQVWYEGAKSFSDVHSQIAIMYTTLTPVFTTQYRSGSDSWSFYQHGYPATFCIERDFSPYYHSPNDQLQYLDMMYAKDIVKSGLATLLTLDMLPPNVRNLSARDKGNGTSIFISWDSVKVPDWSTYKIYVGTSSGNYDTNFTVTSRTKFITGLTQNLQYFIGVSIVDLVGREGMISEISATPRVIPNAPTGITATPILWSIILSWNNNREMDMHSYKLYRAVSPSTEFTLYSTLPYPDTMFVEDDTISAGLYSYFVTAIDSAGNESATSDTVSASPITDVHEGNESNPTEITLMQNFPNPFNPQTVIGFSLLASGNVSLKVFDVLGREVATLLYNETMQAGKHEIQFDASALTSGVYVYQLTTQKKTLTHKMLLMK
ncbi:MAG: M20/M25/M40 family metallo-hydrolase, partial [Bacteroidota bacterium]